MLLKHCGSQLIREVYCMAKLAHVKPVWPTLDKASILQYGRWHSTYWMQPYSSRTMCLLCYARKESYHGVAPPAVPTPWPPGHSLEELQIAFRTALERLADDGRGHPKENIRPPSKHPHSSKAPPLNPQMQLPVLELSAGCCDSGDHTRVLS